MFQLLPQDLENCSHQGLRRLERRLSGLRVAPVLWVFEVAVSLVLQQRVTFREAAQSYAKLLQRYGQPAPGPLPLLLPLSPEQWLELGSDRLQAVGVDPKRARTVMRLAGLGLSFGSEQLAALKGIGPWTLESVKGIAWGDPDAVPPGDVHLPHLVGHFFTGRYPGTDQQMLELLEPYRGLRGRVVRLIATSG